MSERGFLLMAGAHAVVFAFWLGWLWAGSRK